ncbi:MAG TPA: EAL domain-containing protein [Nitriliruptorales bacterium]|nr:EAL domain-containing protein [Nitriliruptorales bacterium]
MLDDRAVPEQDIDAAARTTSFAGRAARITVQVAAVVFLGIEVSWVLAAVLASGFVVGEVLEWRGTRSSRTLEFQVTHQAFHDPLTGLANRALLADRLAQAGRRAARHGRLALLVLDLDGFKAVNDSMGHAAGDALLVAVAERIRSSVRAEDTAARLGGDEFAVLLEDLEVLGGVARVAERLLAAIRQPVDIGGTQVRTHASIGIAVSAGDETPEDLLRDADIAMYAAKDAGKDRYRVFETAMHVSLIEQLEREGDLARAIEAREFELFYQPVVAIEDRGLSGVEAVVRWRHRHRGLLTADQFLPVAEETGMIVSLGRSLLHEACRQLQEWQRRFPHHHPPHISIDVSPRQLLGHGFVDDVAQALSASGLAPQALLLEFPEAALVADSDGGIDRLRQLKDLGVRLAIDHFGSGYSSLAYLRSLPIDLLKIERSFTNEAGDAHLELLRAVIEFCRGRGIETVAEGVDDAAQLPVLRGLGFEHAQGALFSPPLDPAGVAAVLATGAAIVDLQSPTG